MMYILHALDKQDGHDHDDQDSDYDNLKNEMNQEDSSILSFSLAKPHGVDQKDDEGPLAHEGLLGDADDGDIYI